jgi:Universal stress protein family
VTPQTPRVLVAASGSVASRQATAVAANLASTFEAQLVILRVVPPVEYRVGRLAPTLPITRRLDDPLANPVLLEARRVAWARGASAKAILAAGVLTGLVLNTAFGLWWADPAVALGIAALAVREGRETWRGEGCCAASPIPGGPVDACHHDCCD